MMKNKIVVLSAIFCLGFLIPSASAQAIVKVRPVRPAVIVKKPAKIKRGYVWREGQWVYRKRQGKYVWVKGHAVKSRRGKVWVAGRWKSAPGGQIWVPLRWK